MSQGDEEWVSELRKECLEPLDDLIYWWVQNKYLIHAKHDIVAKCSGMITQMKDHRSNVDAEIQRYKNAIIHLKELQGSHGRKSAEFECGRSKTIEILRKLNEVRDELGHHSQALVTRWFHESNHFEINDMEVEADNCNYDLEITNEGGAKYDIEVWYGRSMYEHATAYSTSILDFEGDYIHADPGSNPERFTDVVSKYGGADLNSKKEYPKIIKKLRQMPGYNAGFLIACRQKPTYQVLGIETDFPIMSQECIPPNKCIIVLDFERMAYGKREAGYFLCRQDFKHFDVARQIIEALGFRHDPGRYERKRLVLQNYGFI